MRWTPLLSFQLHSEEKYNYNYNYTVLLRQIHLNIRSVQCEIYSSRLSKIVRYYIAQNILISEDYDFDHTIN